jgi:hypothetical protein
VAGEQLSVETIHEQLCCFRVNVPATGDNVRNAGSEPETVVRWHRGGFRLYWKLLSRVRRPIGRRQTSKEVRELIFRMVVENPTWGASRIHGELFMLGFDVSERTVSRWMKRAPRDPEPARRWLTFLRNHREAIAAMDFFTVPMITFSVLYCYPTSLWIVRQLREAFHCATGRAATPVRSGCLIRSKLASRKRPHSSILLSIYTGIAVGVLPGETLGARG